MEKERKGKRIYLPQEYKSFTYTGDFCHTGVFHMAHCCIRSSSDLAREVVWKHFCKSAILGIGPLSVSLTISTAQSFFSPNQTIDPSGFFHTSLDHLTSTQCISLSTTTSWYDGDLTASIAAFILSAKDVDGDWAAPRIRDHASGVSINAII